MIEPDSRDCTAFISPFGTFHYIRMPFGLCNAGSVYSRMLDQAVSHLPREFWASYLHDMLAFSKGNWEHFGHLKAIVEAHLKAGIKIQTCKVKLFGMEREYLGHRVSPQGVEMVPDYVNKIQEWSVPTAGKEVAMFLGFCGYYCSFIPLYSALTNRMNSIRKTDKFLWTTDMQQDFKTLKQEFQIGRVQAFPDFCSRVPFRVTTDWSKENIAGILSQNQGGEEKFIGCWGRICNQYERNYPSYTGELLAVIQCIKKWVHILRYRPFEIYRFICVEISGFYEESIWPVYALVCTTGRICF